jgi:hypothetical protein
LCVPVFHRGRRHIDFSEMESYEEKLEELVRWIFDKPQYVKPPLGTAPAYITEDNPANFLIKVSSYRAVEAIKGGKPNALGVVKEYLTTLADGLEKFCIVKYDGEFDDAIVQSIEDFLPNRTEFINLLFAFGHYASEESYIEALHKYFEKVISYMHRPQHINQYNEHSWDNFKFIIHEMFLYAVAIFINHEKWHYAHYLMQNDYYSEENAPYGRNTLVSYTAFREPVRSLNYRNERLKLGKLSIQADMLKARAESSGLKFHYLMQADFILYIRKEIENNTEQYRNQWFPTTLVYTDRHYGSFEVFARAQSKRYFDKMKILLEIEDKGTLVGLVDEYQQGRRRVIQFQFVSVNPKSLMGVELLATRE